jgi:purine-nucleoside phosphorylase
MVLYQDIANYLNSKTKYRPQIGIICGSGLSKLSNSLTNTEVFEYKDIPGFPTATVPGHAGELVFGLLGGIETVCMRGRFHFYEGNEMDKVVLPVRVMRLMGVKLLIVTNAAGGINPEFNVGDIMIIQDHYGLPTSAGNTPLRGLNDDALGPRFIAMSDAYDLTLQNYVLDAASKLGLTKIIRPDGTYCFLSGPTYETPTEGRFLRLLGVDSVGMSTVPEIVVARHCGMKILGLSLITNKVICDKKEKDMPHATHEEVLEAVEISGKHVEAIIKEIAKEDVLGAYLARLPNFTYDETKNTHHASAATGSSQVAKSDCKCVPKCQCGSGCGSPKKECKDKVAKRGGNAQTWDVITKVAFGVFLGVALTRALACRACNR